MNLSLNGAVERLRGFHLLDRHLQPRAFLRLFAVGFFDDRVLVAERVVRLVISSNIAFCWRCNSAVQKPRAAPAQVFAALSHRLSQGFFAISVLPKQANAPR